MKKIIKEWTVDSSWGKVAMVSWGGPSNPPVLLVHGYMDSAATFILLVDQLPDTFYYVSFDMPGHGKSDPFPPGLIVSQLNIVEVIRLVVEHMKWDKFLFISHSMGFVIGVFYNHLYPGKITKMVHLDPAPPLSMYYYSHNDPTYLFQHIYDTFYISFKKWNAGSTQHLTFDEAVNLLARNRSLSEDRAEVVLSRSLVLVGDGKYKLSWDPRMKKIATVALSEETLYTVITQHASPMLIVESSENKSVPSGRQFAANILKKCRLMVPNFNSVTVIGGHDVHITNPECISPYIEDFFKSDIANKNYVKSKL